MENYRKIIGTLVVIFLSTFFVHNVSAFNITTEVQPTDNSWDFSNSQYQYKPGPNQAWTTSSGGSTGTLRFEDYSPVTFNRKDIYGIRPVKKITIKNGLYYSTQLNINWTYVNQNIAHSKSLITNHFVNDDDFSVVSWDGGQCNEITANQVTPSSQTDLYAYSCWYEIVLQAKHDGDVYFQLGNGTNLLGFGINPFISAWKIQPVQELAPVDQTVQAEQKTEEQSEEGQNNADQSDSDNQQATSSLLDIAGSIIGALTTTSGSCTFNADLGNVDFGELNLCSGKPPEFANIIDIVIMLMLIPLIFMTVVSLVHQFINLTKFAQGGD